jgi:hypothetical protein
MGSQPEGSVACSTSCLLEPGPWPLLPQGPPRVSTVALNSPPSPPSPSPPPLPPSPPPSSLPSPPSPSSTSPSPPPLPPPTPSLPSPPPPLPSPPSPPPPSCASVLPPWPLSGSVSLYPIRSSTCAHPSPSTPAFFPSTQTIDHQHHDPTPLSYYRVPPCVCPTQGEVIPFPGAPSWTQMGSRQTWPVGLLGLEGSVDLLGSLGKSFPL